MCGIAGVAHLGGSGLDDSALVRAMCALIAHRGPDDEGYYHDPAVTLGMRRLSIIDVAGGHQPVQNEDGSVWVVFNGEIYNFRELRAELEAAGHTFASRSDTETIVHAYEAYGDAFAEHLDGMFAIALWDRVRRRLILVRDRFGKKPLFYARVPSGLIFGSELKCLLLHPEFRRDVSPQALDDYLAYGYVPAPRSIFAGAAKVRPAHLLVYADGQLEERPYWRLPPRTERGELTPAARRDAADQLEHLLEAAVRKRLISDVPLGAFLSGGLDSSVVVALMSRLMREPVKTFTIGLHEPRFDESAVARHTAALLGTDHRELIVRPDFERLLPTIAWGMDEPQSDPSLVPTYYVSQLARQHVTVCLTGDGGDEAFAGYDRYRLAEAERAFDRVPMPLRSFAGALSAALPNGLRGKRKLARMPLRWTQRYAAGLTHCSEALRAGLYQPSWRAQLHGYRAMAHYDDLFGRQRHADMVSALQWADIHSYLTDDVLAKVDRMSMVNSIETRAPLLDHRLVEFAFSLPASAFHSSRLGKLLFRDIARRLVPTELLDRPKQGFGIPIAEWLRGPLGPQVDSVLLGGGLAGRGWFRDEQIRRLVREHRGGVFDHGTRLWALLMLELWARQFLDTAPRSLAAPARELVAC